MHRSFLVAVAILLVSDRGSAAWPLVAGYERFGRQDTDDAGRVDAGLLLLGELGCVHCHAAAEPTLTHLAPKKAPVLDAVGRRLDPAWLAAYLADPQGVHPGTTMPDLLGDLPADSRVRTATALAHYLASTEVFAAGPFPGSEKADAGAGASLKMSRLCGSVLMYADKPSSSLGTTKSRST
jgi:hypothetical protein